MAFEKITNLIINDMDAVNQTIIDGLSSEVALINQISYHIISSGGKRIRPMISLLTAKALNYEGTQHIKAAALIEYIHTATLLHDDVVDESELRRGKKTANSHFGNAASVLVGDFIYTRAFQIMTELDSLPILKIMSDTTNIIAEGEVQQLINCNDPDLTEEKYFEVIYSKTARLFQAASQISAILSGATSEQELCLSNYGRYLGTAFQLIDDLLDYTSDNPAFGKNTGDDLEEGKITLPLIHTLKHANSTESQLIKEAIIKGHARNELSNILNIMEKYGSLEYTLKKAEEESQKAIQNIAIFNDTPYKNALISLAQLAVKRSV